MKNDILIENRANSNCNYKAASILECKMNILPKNSDNNSLSDIVKNDSIISYTTEKCSIFNDNNINIETNKINFNNNLYNLNKTKSYNEKINKKELNNLLVTKELDNRDIKLFNSSKNQVNLNMEHIKSYINQNSCKLEYNNNFNLDEYMNKHEIFEESFLNTLYKLKYSDNYMTSNQKKLKSFDLDSNVIVNSAINNNDWYNPNTDDSKNFIKDFLVNYYNAENKSSYKKKNKIYIIKDNLDINTRINHLKNLNYQNIKNNQMTQEERKLRLGIFNKKQDNNRINIFNKKSIKPNINKIEIHKKTSSLKESKKHTNKFKSRDESKNIINNLKLKNKIAFKKDKKYSFKQKEKSLNLKIKPLNKSFKDNCTKTFKISIDLYNLNKKDDKLLKCKSFSYFQNFSFEKKNDFYCNIEKFYRYKSSSFNRKNIYKNLIKNIFYSSDVEDFNKSSIFNNIVCNKIERVEIDLYNLKKSNKNKKLIKNCNSLNILSSKNNNFKLINHLNKHNKKYYTNKYSLSTYNSQDKNFHKNECFNYMLKTMSFSSKEKQNIKAGIINNVNRKVTNYSNDTTIKKQLNNSKYQNIKSKYKDLANYIKKSNNLTNKSNKFNRKYNSNNSKYIKNKKTKQNSFYPNLLLTAPSSCNSISVFERLYQSKIKNVKCKQIDFNTCNSAYKISKYSNFFNSPNSTFKSTDKKLHKIFNSKNLYNNLKYSKNLAYDTTNKKHNYLNNKNSNSTNFNINRFNTNIYKNNIVTTKIKKLTNKFCNIKSDFDVKKDILTSNLKSFYYNNITKQNFKIINLKNNKLDSKYYYLPNNKDIIKNFNYNNIANEASAKKFQFKTSKYTKDNIFKKEHNLSKFKVSNHLSNKNNILNKSNSSCIFARKLKRLYSDILLNNKNNKSI